MFIVGKAFKDKTDFYEYPMKSSFLDIYKCKKDNLNDVSMTEISELDRKLFAMDDTINFIFFPMSKFSEFKGDE